MEICGGIAQLGARLTGSQEVVGSSPTISTNEFDVRTLFSGFVFLLSPEITSSVYRKAHCQMTTGFLVFMGFSCYEQDAYSESYSSQL